MEVRKFKIGNREVEDYYLSNSDLMYLINSDKTSEEDKAYLLEKMKSRFTAILCPRCGEDKNDVFVRYFSDFVNGSYDKTKVAEKMCCDHRYLQNEMFKVCLEYIKKLAENCEKGFYDPRNKYACETSKKIIDFFNEIKYPY
jgi:hypothetical protein